MRELFLLIRLQAVTDPVQNQLFLMNYRFADKREMAKSIFL